MICVLRGIDTRVVGMGRRQNCCYFTRTTPSRLVTHYHTRLTHGSLAKTFHLTYDRKPRSLPTIFAFLMSAWLTFFGTP